MADINMKLTTAGQVLAAKIEQGDGTIPLEITRIVTVAVASNDPLNQVFIEDDIRQEFAITSRTQVGATAKLRGRLDNFGDAGAGIPPLDEGYPVAQVWVCAMDPDEGEIIYRLSQPTNPGWMPAFRERPMELTPIFTFTVGNATEVIIEIAPGDWATVDALENLRWALEDHIYDASVHVTPEWVESVGQIISELVAHANNTAIHITPEERMRWDQAAQNALDALALAQINAGRIAGLAARVTQIEDSLFNELGANPWNMTFENLDGIQVIEGIWNLPFRRVEC